MYFYLNRVIVQEESVALLDILMCVVTCVIGIMDSPLL